MHMPLMLVWVFACSLLFSRPSHGLCFLFPNPSPRQIKYNKFYNNCFSVKLGKNFSLFIHLFSQHFSEYWSINHSSRDWSSNSDQNMNMECILQCSYLQRKESAVGHLLLIPPPKEIFSEVWTDQRGCILPNNKHSRDGWVAEVERTPAISLSFFGSKY